MIAFTEALETETRAEIKEKAESVFSDISQEIREIWDALHPNARITEVKLYTPKDADKAIDIALVFYGKTQDSPRLTLSEGYRNALGLAIFLAMARRSNNSAQPLFLDDVVTSLDRAHRGLLSLLLEKHFFERQIVIFTHDRTWFSELRSMLDHKRWSFLILKQWESPNVGIQLLDKSSDFVDARAQLLTRPEDASHDARRIMDTELAIVSEKLESELPFKRGEANDRRTWSDFLRRLKSDSKKRFQTKKGADYVDNSGGTAKLEMAFNLMSAWANKGSHTFDAETNEATAMIDACEAAIDVFWCADCDSPVWALRADNNSYCQCKCGALRWKLN